ENGLWHEPDVEPDFSETLELDLSTVEPSLAGPKRPQDRVPLKSAKSMFREALGAFVDGDSVQNGVDESVAETFPASDPTAPGANLGETPVPSAAAGARGRTSNPISVKFADGADAV